MRLAGLILIILYVVAPGAAALAAGPDSARGNEPVVYRNQNEAAVVQIVLPAEAELAPVLARGLRDEAEATVAGFLADAIVEQERRQRDMPGAHREPFSLYVNFKPTMISAEVVSLLKVMDLYTGGAHGMTEFEGIIFDRRRRAIVGPEQIFSGGEGWQGNGKRLSALASVALKKMKAERLGREYEALSAEGWVDDFQLPLQSMTLVPSNEPGKIGGVSFDFAPYAAGSFAEGIYHVVLPAEDVVGMAGTDWQPLFGGRPDLLAYAPTNDPNGGHFALIREPRMGAAVKEKIAASGEAPAQLFEGDLLPFRVLQQGNVVSEGALSANRQLRPSGTALGMIPFVGTIDVGRGAGGVVIRLGRTKSVDIPVVVER